MLVMDYQVIPVSSATAKLVWQGQIDTHGWVFHNGERLYGPIHSDSVTREIPIPWQKRETLALEIHELPLDVTPEAISAEPNTRPVLVWNPAPDAIRYRLYHREAGEADALVADWRAMEGLEQYRVKCPISLTGHWGKWHFLRVEAVNIAGQESTRQSWAYFAMEPALATPPVITPGSEPGLYNITIQ